MGKFIIIPCTGIGMRITMCTNQVAAPGYIPHYDGAFVAGKLQKITWKTRGVPSIA